MAQVLESPPPMWETWKEFLVPDFGMAQVWSCKSLVSEPNDENLITGLVLLSLSLYQSNDYTRNFSNKWIKLLCRFGLGRGGKKGFCISRKMEKKKDKSLKHLFRENYQHFWNWYVVNLRGKPSPMWAILFFSNNIQILSLPCHL